MSCIGLPSTQRPLFCVLCSAMSPGTGAHNVIPYQVAGFHCTAAAGGTLLYNARLQGFHELLQWAHSHTVPGCWVPRTAAVFRLLYSARLLSSMHCCCLYIVIPLQVAGFHVWLYVFALLYRARLLGFMHGCCVYIVITMPGCWVPCTAAVCILLYSARLLGSMHCC